MQRRELPGLRRNASLVNRSNHVWFPYFAVLTGDAVASRRRSARR